ncbi:MAG: hypothetical protein IPK72_10735 [Candidatus Eisenbacteria bacterium]|nr:hypothetical protein [Candidatus Eisenbacteria bacterium]
MSSSTRAWPNPVPESFRAEQLDESRWSEWDTFLTRSPESRLRQTSHYARALRLYGWSPSVLILRDSSCPESPIVAGALIGEKKLPLVGGCRLQVSGGIAIPPGTSEAVTVEFLAALERHGRERGAVWIQLEWRRPLSIDGVACPDGETARDRLLRTGYEQGEQTGTYFISLAGHDRETMLAALGRQARQNIRHAVRDAVEVVEERDLEGTTAFRDYHREMSQRKGLGSWPDGFERDVLLGAIQAGAAKLLSARNHGKRINMILLSAVGAPLYEWGAIGPRENVEAAPPTGEFLHYEAMCRFLGGPHPTYDLGGSPGPDPVAGHPNYSVWRFKKKLGGKFVWFAGEGRKVLIPWKTKAIELLRPGRATG